MKNIKSTLAVLIVLACIWRFAQQNAISVTQTVMVWSVVAILLGVIFLFPIRYFTSKASGSAARSVSKDPQIGIIQHFEDDWQTEYSFDDSTVTLAGAGSSPTIAQREVVLKLRGLLPDLTNQTYHLICENCHLKGSDSNFSEDDLILEKVAIDESPPGSFSLSFRFTRQVEGMWPTYETHFTNYVMDDAYDGH